MTVTGKDGREQPQVNQAKAGASRRTLDSPSHVRRLLSVKEAAVYLGVSPWTVRSLGWSREIPEVRIGRRVLYDREDLDLFITQAKQ